MQPSATALCLKDVTKQYDAPSGSGPLRILDSISLEVAPGESIAIVGPSGSGKSTLLQIIGTLDRPTSGQLWFDGQDISQLNDLDLAGVRNQRIGFVFQAHYLLPQCTVFENILVPTLAKTKLSASPAVPTPAGSARESNEARAQRLLQRVGLGRRLEHRPGELSGGERQRVAIVRALINRPQLLLADEPTGSLDHASALSLTQLLIEINKEEGVTLIVVTHSRDLAQRMSRVLELEDGKWKAKG